MSSYAIRKTPGDTAWFRHDRFGMFIHWGLYALLAGSYAGRESGGNAEWIMHDLHIPPENVIVAGDSAGGGLSLALLMYLRDNSFTLPAAVILFSPWVGKFINECHWFHTETYRLTLPLRSHNEL